ncbi:TIGR04282 family arsenosugar biosynthesis glycosyltransferase [Neolewinella litorea]|uniref:DUF2064 domain-containing protein n=1 Tax=Neolewinella litorea TaxID=2562452 RepID=A0A4V3XLJ7_9BACT|nr:DUF2064 domain-containing protein [Neolewinella litorea]THH41193.1 DUF2064 domain-containing protein [Neolewinella litorea]
MPSSTAILLFSRSALAESDTKRFGSRSESVQIQQAMLDRTLATLRRAGLPIFHHDERQQRGFRFGDRLVNAMSDVYARGFERLIVVGNDCPLLSCQYVNSAVQAMEAGRSVLGPDHRGGIWLLGLGRDQFDPAAFREISWQGPEVFDQLKSALPGGMILARLVDVNAPKDLRRFRHVLRGVMRKVYLLLSQDTTSGPQGSGLRAIVGSEASVSGRAPPRAA